MSKVSEKPTLYLGPAVVTQSEFNFGEATLTAPTPVNSTDIANKLYVDQLVQSQADRINTLLDGTTVDLDQLKELSDYAKHLSEVDNATVEAALAVQSANIASNHSFVLATKTALESADVSILTAIASEATTRTVNDAALNASIVSLTNTYSAYVASNNSKISLIESTASSEASTRSAADVVLQTNINNLQTATQNAAATLQSSLLNSFEVAIAQESASRQAGDEDLQSKIDSLAAQKDTDIAAL
jgi:hypothetical protein